MSCGSQLDCKYPMSPAMRGSKPTGATGTVITSSPSDLAAPLSNLQPAAEHSMNHQWPFPLPQLPAIQSTCLVLKNLYQHYEYSAALLLKSHTPFLVLKFKTVLNSGKDALMLETHLCGRRCLTAKSIAHCKKFQLIGSCTKVTALKFNRLMQDYIPIRKSIRIILYTNRWLRKGKGASITPWITFVEMQFTCTSPTYTTHRRLS